MLNDFVSQNENDRDETKENNAPQAKTTDTNQSSLDNFVDSENTLDNMAKTEEYNNNLDDFVNETTTNTESFPEEDISSQGDLDDFVSSSENTSSFGGLDDFVSPETEETTTSTDPNALKAEEQELAHAIANFQDGITAIANKKNYKLPHTDYEEKMLLPNYKPSVGKKIAQYLLDCWNILCKYAPQEMKKLSPNATDEDYLTFAEGLTDTYMQLVIISYVEILMNMEICENSYQQKKEEIQKRRIKKELYEEYIDLQERKQMFIEKIKEKNFPIDADNLVNNYFRVAQKDADGSFEALTKNPATFSPIQVEKISPKFFGLIKVTPEDGIKANQKIGKYIKNLKV